MKWLDKILFVIFFRIGGRYFKFVDLHRGKDDSASVIFSNNKEYIDAVSQLEVKP